MIRLISVPSSSFAPGECVRSAVGCNASKKLSSLQHPAFFSSPAALQALISKPATSNRSSSSTIQNLPSPVVLNAMHGLTLSLLPLTAVLVWYVRQPARELIRKAGGFASKTICSAVFVSGRKYDQYLVENELSTLPPFVVTSEIDYEAKQVRSYFINKAIHGLLGLPVSTAVYLGPAFGCQLHAVSPGSQPNSTAVPVLPPDSNSERPKTTVTAMSQCVDAVVQRDFTPAGLARNQTRAVVVVHRGQIISEGYQLAMGITQDTKLLGWSMTKSLHTAVVGAAIQQGLLTLDTPVQLHDLDEAHRRELFALNGGRALTFRDLLQMKDVQRMEEKYGIFDDVSTMLYGSTDAGRFASQQVRKPITAPDAKDKEATFGWYYSSGLSNILAKELRALFPTDAEYLAFPQRHLFSPIGAHSFAMELDTDGTFVASSLSYATARDWARLGELFLRNGAWEGVQVLPADFVDFVQQPHPHSGGHYGGHFWLNPARVSVAEYNALPHDHVEKRKKVWMTQVLPADAYAMNGYLGQNTMIIPSEELVIARLGYTPDAPEGAPPTWDPKAFYGDILTCFQGLDFYPVAN